MYCKFTLYVFFFFFLWEAFVLLSFKVLRQKTSSVVHRIKFPCTLGKVCWLAFHWGVRTFRVQARLLLWHPVTPQLRQCHNSCSVMLGPVSSLRISQTMTASHFELIVLSFMSSFCVLQVNIFFSLRFIFVFCSAFLRAYGRRKFHFSSVCHTDGTSTFPLMLLYCSCN